LKKFKNINKLKTEGTKETIIFLEQFNNNLSDKQMKMLSDLYLENISDGLKPKIALEKALQTVKCFNL
jgi:hypothetical protein